MIHKFPESVDVPVNVFARFFMGYNQDFTEASSRFSTYFEWAKRTNISQLTPEDFPEINSTQPFRVIGHTRNNQFIILVQLKNLHIKSHSTEDFSKFIGSVVFTALEKADQVIDSYYIIIDVKDYTKENFDMEGLKKLMPVFSNYFPDVLYKMTLVNLGFFAANLFSIVMMFMHEVTRKKIKIVKENVQQIKAVLLEEIDLDNIPIAYGGTSSVPVL